MAAHRAITGLDARIRWWQRLMSLVGIALIIGIMGVLLAVSAGAIVIGGRVLLDVLIS